MSTKNTPKEIKPELVPIFIMGKKFDVPSTLTIQKAMEYAGYQLIRGVGCRGGICGACATVYRTPNSYRIEVGLACQTVVVPNMYLTQIPFFPANKAIYDLEELEPKGSTVSELYPEIFKCIGCNSCTRSCPMDIDVMNYISNAIRGDIKEVASRSFDCVMCGLCAARCPSEQVQYNVSILCRRLYGRHIARHAVDVDEMVKKVNLGDFENGLGILMKASNDELKKIYTEREVEPEMADEYWEPNNKEYL